MNKNQKLPILYREKINYLVELLKKLDPDRIILFGSVTAGKIRPDSDIDLCVLKETEKPWKVKEKIWDLLWDSSYDWQIEPDIKVYSPSIYYDWLRRNDPFIEEVEKGEVLYER